MLQPNEDVLNLQEGETLDSTMGLDTQPAIEFNDNQCSENENAWAVLYPAVERLNKFVCYHSSGEMFTFGRSESCNVCLINSHSQSQRSFYRTISCYHFNLTLGPGRIAYITDISTNGTYLNKERLTKGAIRAISHGDNISVASPNYVVYNFVYIVADICPDGTHQKFCSQVLEKYIISCVLGSGSYGEVRMAYCKHSTDKFAIKTLKKKDIRATKPATAKLHAKLRLEADILKLIKHPCITSIHETIETKTHLYIVMEHIAGGELFDFILSNGAIAESAAKLMFYQIAAAVKYLHDHNIVHRDVKPENVILTSNKNPECLAKLTDFGLSRLTNSYSAMMKTYCGTPTYLAPEVMGKDAKGEIAYNCNVDVWSMGVLYFVCLTAQMLFDDYDNDDDENVQDDRNPVQSTLQVRQRIVNSSEKRKFNWSTPLVALLLGMLETNPVNRFSSSDVLYNKWFTDDHFMMNKAYLLTNGFIGQQMLVAEDEDRINHGTIQSSQRSSCIIDFSECSNKRAEILDDGRSDVNSGVSSGFHDDEQISDAANSIPCDLSSGNIDDCNMSMDDVLNYSEKLPVKEFEISLSNKINQQNGIINNLKHNLGSFNNDNGVVKRQRLGDNDVKCVETPRRSKRIIEAVNRRKAIGKLGQPNYLRSANQFK